MLLRGCPTFADVCAAKQLQPAGCTGRYLFVIKSWPWEGNLGNNIICLTHALYLARQTSSELVVPTYRHFTKTGWDFRNDTTADNGDVHRIAVTDAWSFFVKEEMQALLPDWSFGTPAQRELLINEVLPAFRVTPKHERGAVVVHVRSGNIFTNGIHPDYTQPPFAFYQAVLALPELAELRILLCTEDHANPVVDLIVERYTSRVRVITDLDEGMQTMLGAKHLVLARSTFSEGLGKMAPMLESLYFPVCHDLHDVNRLDPVQQQVWADAAYCYEYGDDYIALGSWTASKEQLQLMANYTVDKVVAHHVSIVHSSSSRSDHKAIFTL